MTELAVKNPVVTWLAVFLLIVAGVYSYNSLGKLEDPEFTIKTATIVTGYPGASPEQVEEEVTDVIEEVVQQIAEVDFIESISHAGLSVIKVEVQSKYWSDQLPQIWDMLRRKVRNIETQLPSGAGRPAVGDDFGDVYGFVLAVTGDGFSYQELEHEVKKLKTQLSLVDGVARVEYWGKLPRAIYITLSESRLASLGLGIPDIANALNQQNLHADAGNLYYPDTQLRIEVSGDFSAIQDIEEIVIRGAQGQGELVKLKDIAAVNEGFKEISPEQMRYNGKESIALAISNTAGVDIIALGESLEKTIQQLVIQAPVGIEIHKVAWQQEVVTEAIDGFVISLIEAIVIVLIVLAVGLGWRLSIIIGTALILTILGTLVVMKIFGIDLQRMSLGALVIALGMMVDNAIVVADGVVVRIQQGMDKTKAAIEAAKKPSIPLLGATLIAVLAFYPVAASQHSTGEYCLSLFQVIAISLLFSWLISITVTPIQCISMLAVDNKKTSNDRPNRFILAYKMLLEKMIEFRIFTIVSCVGLLILAILGFTKVPQLFFPDSTRPQFMVDMYAINGTRISQTSEYLRLAENEIMKMEGVESVAGFIGSGPPRFYLPVESEMFYTSYGQLIVTVDDFKKIDLIKTNLDQWLEQNFPEVPVFRVRKFVVGPANTWKFEVRISAPSGTSQDDVRAVGEQGLALISEHPWVQSSQVDWRQPTPKVVLKYDQDRGYLANISKADLSYATARAFDGTELAQYREGNELIPIYLRNNEAERNNPATLYEIQIPQPHSGRPVPLTQVAETISVGRENPYIWRRDRLRTITIQAEPIDGVTLPSLRADVLDEFEKFEASLPPSWKMEWGAETESSTKAKAGLMPSIIPTLAIMFLIIVGLFNSMRPAFIIFLVIPLAVIGITFGLLVTGAPFGFMALLGAMSLAGMMIKNAIVLIDEIKLNENEKSLQLYDAIVQAGLSRLRPVALAAATTVLGVIPLVQDVFWVSMAVTIMAGLTFGAILTMLVLPALYATFYKVYKTA